MRAIIIFTLSLSLSPNSFGGTKAISSCSKKAQKVIRKKFKLIRRGRSDNMSKYLNDLTKMAGNCSNPSQVQKYINNQFKKSVNKRLKNKIQQSIYAAKFRDVTNDLNYINDLQ